MTGNYLVEEAVDDGEVLPRVGGKDLCRVIFPRHVERRVEVEQGVFGKK